MTKRISKLIAFVLAFCMIMPTAAMAAESAPVPTVRVNGHAVDFPDAKPFYDENNRIMIPVRFVSEELGATVTWNDNTRTATIAKGYVSIDVPINSNTITVYEYGAGMTVKMDTTAVLKDGRTYVPIRYVAEALGAYVDYADAFRTVGIYSGVLTAEEIADLRSYPYTQPRGALGYEEYKAMSSAEDVEKNFGPYRETFGNFANAHEYLYTTLDYSIKYLCDDLGITLKAANAAEYYDAIAREAAAEIGYSSERLTVEFKTDPSCVYQPDAHSGLFVSVRGILTITLHVHVSKMTTEEVSFLLDLDYEDFPSVGVPTSYPLDLHMNTQGGRYITIHSIINPSK